MAQAEGHGPAVPCTLAQVLEVLERAYPSAGAEDWDAVGLVCGDPSARVERILVAVDPAPAVVAEALACDADLLLVHHPLLLRPVTSVASIDAKGRALHDLIGASVGLVTAHTNADVATPGVSDALAAALGVQVTAPITAEGLGRIGRLAAPMPLREFAEAAAAVLPQTAQGVRVSGDPDQIVEIVALCGGAGDSLLRAVAATDADVFVTSDLRHHRALEHRLNGGCALVDVAHFAGEWPWCEQAASILRGALPGATVMVSTLVTDPWSLQVRSPL